MRKKAWGDDDEWQMLGGEQTDGPGAARCAKRRSGRRQGHRAAGANADAELRGQEKKATFMSLRVRPSARPPSVTHSPEIREKSSARGANRV